MHKKFFKPLELKNIPFNFSLTFPVDGKDTLCIYNDRVFALKSYGYRVAGGEGTIDKGGLFNLSKFFLKPRVDDNLNFIDSNNTYEDVMQYGVRKSRIYFSWEGVCDSQGIELMENYFLKNEDVIYSDFTQWLNVQKQISISERSSSNNYISSGEELYDISDRIERELEERISILVYQGVKRTNYFKNKIKRLKIFTLMVTVSYVIAISYAVFYKLL